MTKEIKDFELIVSEGRLPLWRLLIAACFFSGMLYYLYYAILGFYYLGFCLDSFKIFAGLLGGISFCFTGGVSFSVIKTIMIDIDKNKLISIYSVGPFSKKIPSVVPELEYVSVFLNSKDIYEVNLWYKGNKHYTMYAFGEKQPAMKFGEQVSAKLDIDLLDATEKGNSKWIDKTAL